MDGRGIEDRHRAVLGADEHGDLGAAEDDALGAAPDEVLDDPDVRASRLVPDRPVFQLLVDDVVNCRPSSMYRTWWRRQGTLKTLLVAGSRCITKQFGQRRLGIVFEDEFMSRVEDPLVVDPDDGNDQKKQKPENDE